MKRTESGYLYKRFRGKYYKADSLVPGTWYLAFKSGGKAYFYCLHTKDRDEAEQRRHVHLSTLVKSDRVKYLAALVEQGERARAELQAHIQNPAAITIADAWTRFVESRRRPASGESTMRGYQTAWKHFSAWCPRHVKTMRDLTPALAEDYIRQMERKDGKARTIRAHLQALRLVWKCLDPGQPSPWTALHTTKETSVTSYRALTPEEVGRIAACARGEYLGLILIGYTTGLRRKDACLLDWGQIDMKGRMIELTPAKTSRKRMRVNVPLLPDAEEHLKKTPAAKREGPVFPEIAALYKSDNTKVGEALRDLFNAAHVWDSEAGKASFHSFRATWQTLNDESGTSRVVARAVLGHSSQSMSDTYSKMDVMKSRKQIEKAIPRLNRKRIVRPDEKRP